MLRNREGFTLIELLIVVVIIGILAAIALPKFGETRERAYVSAMQSDLRNLQTEMEMYYANDYTYSGATITNLDFVPSAGVTINLDASNAQGWSATATHAAITDGTTCAVYVGDGVTPAAPADDLGVVSCGTT
ncbi:MAG: prepilin-type N-terminal cleavage/methylation domain-containing protein [Acidimicrobiia bacterium]